MMQIDMEELIRDYIFASSAGYVYDRFTRNDSVKNLAKIKTPDILVKEYKKRTEKEERTIEDMVVTYAILVGITFLDYSQASSIFDKIDLSKIEWGQDIKDRYMRNVRPTVFVSGESKGIPIKVEETKSKDSSTFSDVRMNEG